MNTLHSSSGCEAVRIEGETHFEGQYVGMSRMKVNRFQPGVFLSENTIDYNHHQQNLLIKIWPVPACLQDTLIVGTSLSTSLSVFPLEGLLSIVCSSKIRLVR